MAHRLPDHMPIVARRMAAGDYRPVYTEREITEPVDLCDASGLLNPSAIGWSRIPLFRGNLSGSWLRKKRWNFWNWIAPEFVFSVTLADIDYASFCSVAFTDFSSGESFSGMFAGPAGRFDMPEHVDRTVTFRRGSAEYAALHEEDCIRVEFAGPVRGGGEIVAAFVVRKPPGHESLNVVVPWSPRRFQLNSKHNTLPCEGHVTVGGRRYAMDPSACHAVQDWGRGIWPYRSFWNWGVGTGTVEGRLVGVNLGGKWTTGTGSNENGILLEGRLHKIMEDLRWSYDTADWRKPWHVVAEHSGAVDLRLEPLVVKESRLNLGIVRTGGACAFGRWSGTLRVDGQTIEVRDLIGWAEEFAHRW